MNHDVPVTDPTAAETLPDAQALESVPPQPEAAAQPVAVAEAAIETVATPVPEVEVVPAAASPRRKAAPRQLVSDETLEAWQSTLAAKQAAKDRAERKLRSEVSARQDRAESFRILRQALQQAPAEASAEAEIDPELQALADDTLARQVHQAPAHVREVLAATLAMIAGKRRRSRR